jgi:hypothetical protein
MKCLPAAITGSISTALPYSAFYFHSTVELLDLLDEDANSR